MCKPHKHAVAIKAWADGKCVQQRVANGEWVDVLCPCPSWHLDWEYRIKPEVIKYKRYVFKNYHDNRKEMGIVVFRDGSKAADQIEAWEKFVRWIDNELVEQEV